MSYLLRPILLKNLSFLTKTFLLRCYSHYCWVITFKLPSQIFMEVRGRRLRMWVEKQARTYQIAEVYDSAIKMKNRLTSAMGTETDFIVIVQ